MNDQVSVGYQTNILVYFVWKIRRIIRQRNGNLVIKCEIGF